MSAIDLVPAFVNTRRFSERVPTDRDLLAEPADLDRWWGDRAGAAPPAAGRPGTDRDLTLARDLREGLRAQLARHNDATTDADGPALARFEDAARQLPLRVLAPGPGDSAVLAAADDTVPEALVAVLAAVVRARMDGTWSRLKICRDPHCREAYRDTSRNRSRTWCSMEVCGARSKQRAFVDRRRAADRR